MAAVRETWMIGRLLFAVVLVALALQALPQPAAADWLSWLVVGSERSATKASAKGAGTLEAAALHIKVLPAASGPALAGHVNAEGHWSFVNAAGERFTAGTPDELKRVVGVLAPEAAGGDKRLTIVLTEDSVFNQRGALKDLPRTARLMIGFGDEAYALSRRGEGAAERLYAEVRPNLLIEIGERRLFDEAAWQLARPLDRARIRVLALEPGATQSLAPTPRFDPQTKRALTDTIDPARLPQALSAIGRQTAVLSGRIEGDLLWFQPGSGGQRSLVMKDLVASAEAADVNLIVLQSPTPRQPGARNWLWQRVSVDGLDAALDRAHLADFLNAIGGDQSRLLVTAAPTGQLASGTSGRIALKAVPIRSDGATLSGLSEIFSDLVSDVAGKVVTSAVEANMISAERQAELDRRLIPGIPAGIQMLYLAGLLLGLVGLVPARRLFERIWPAETRDGYSGAAGFQAARAVRLGLFALAFMPAVALVTAPVAVLGQGRKWLAALAALMAWPLRSLRRGA